MSFLLVLLGASCAFGAPGDGKRLNFTVSQKPGMDVSLHSIPGVTADRGVRLAPPVTSVDVQPAQPSMNSQEAAAPAPIPDIPTVEVKGPVASIPSPSPDRAQEALRSVAGSEAPEGRLTSAANIPLEQRVAMFYDCNGELQSLPEETAPVESERVRQAFHTMPAGLRKSLRTLYVQEVGKFWNGTQRTPAIGARIYAQRLERGEDSAFSMLGLGFRPGRDRVLGAILDAPISLLQVFARYDARILRLINAGVVAQNEVIHPSLVFVPTKPKKGSAGSYLFVRPGLDPWPDEGSWTLATETAGIPGAAWYGAVAEGRMPISIPRILFHELAHVGEFFSHPELMRLMRRLASRAVSTAEGPRHSAENLRNFILSETLSLPNVANADSIRALIPHWFAPGGPRSLEEGVALLMAKETRELRRRAHALRQNVDLILSRHGGGMRDASSIYNYIEGLSFAFSPAHWWRQLRVTNPFDDEEALTNTFAETLHFLAERLAALAEVEWVDARTAGASADKQHAKRKRSFVEYLAQFEYALYTAVRLNLRPETVYREARLQPPAPGSATHEYFKAVYEPGSWHRKAFVGDP